jgi:hypothetical protein
MEMSDAQLQLLIDAISRSGHLITAANVICLLLLAAVGSMLYFVKAYAGEKGKNLATKADIGKITSEIEQAKSTFAERLERLRSELQTRGHFNKLRYERELQLYEEIWPKLAALRQAALSLRPFLDMVDPQESEDARKQRRSAQYSEAHQAMTKVVEEKRPFFPPEIWKDVTELLKLCGTEAIQYKIMERQPDVLKYAENAQGNADGINARVNSICDAIRDRLGKFDDA